MTKRFRIAEIFGPTIQGEGRHVGVPCHFIRFGGCDLRCTWCDSLHAVLPEYVAELPQLTTDQIINKLDRLPGAPHWIVFSGGNPALLDLELLLDALHLDDKKVMVETQGTVFKSWLEDVDELCISPKPPSSRNQTTQEVLREFLDQFEEFPESVYLKVVVFNENDYGYAKYIHNAFSQFNMFLSVGNTMPPHPSEKVLTQDPIPELRKKIKWLFTRVAHDPHMGDVRVLPQQHLFAWGNDRGH